MLGYVAFGAGNVTYMTFVIALLGSQGGSPDHLSLFWSILGSSALVTLVWGRFLGKVPNSVGPAAVCFTAMLGTIPVLLWSGPSAIYLSKVVVGGSHLAGPTAIAIVTQRQLRPEPWTAAIAMLTVGFALGQAVGPAIAGFVSDFAGSITAGFWLSPVFLGCAALVSLLQRPPVAGLR